MINPADSPPTPIIIAIARSGKGSAIRDNSRPKSKKERPHNLRLDCFVFSLGLTAAPAISPNQKLASSMPRLKMLPLRDCFTVKGKSKKIGNIKKFADAKVYRSGRTSSGMAEAGYAGGAPLLCGTEKSSAIGSAGIGSENLARLVKRAESP